MRIIIIPDDSLVSVDGIAYRIDCSSVDSSIHAVQWMDDYGVLEFKDMGEGRPGNERITDMTPFQEVLTLWNAAHVAANQPPAPPPIPVEALVALSYRSSLRRKAKALESKGKTFEAVQMLLKSRG